ncbi:MAG: hypothetical protein ACLGI9_20015, partial [Thermoanaerobaculia bacterium]
MEDEHFPRETIERFMEAELSREETREIVRHLLARCRICLAAVGAAARREELTPGRVSGAEPAAPGLYDEVFDKVLSGTEETRMRLSRERLRAGGQWSALEGQPQARRLVMIHNDRRLQTWGLYDRLLEDSRQVGQDPGEAVNLAALALAVVGHLSPGVFGPEQLAEFRSTALAALGNARRLARDFEGAREAFREAWAALEEGEDDPLEEASLVSLEASLLCDLGELEEAAQLLERALALYREGGDLHFQGRTLLKQALAVGSLDPARGVELVEEALVLIDAVREPRLELCARHNLSWLLNDNGQAREALAMLETSRS